MTVAELMEKLEELDPAMKVIMPSRDGDHCEVARVHIDTVAGAGPEVQLTDIRSPEGMYWAVRLMGQGEEA